ncbi:MAG: AzlD domain-containing protein [Pseudomonadota bacterium]
MLSEGSYLIAVAAMALVVLVSRLSGAFVMAWVTPTPRVEKFLEGMAVSVIAALVASSLVTADTKTFVATGCAVIVAIFLRNVIFAMIAGMLTAAAFPHII